MNHFPGRKRKKPHNHKPRLELNPTKSHEKTYNPKPLLRFKRYGIDVKIEKYKC